MRNVLAALLLALPVLAQEAPADKPVEQTKKNIKVLNGMPSSQLIPVMAFMSNSLGVTCSFCHNPKAWDSDEVETKDTARQMIQMQRAINDKWFEGQPVVSCNTCHQGHVRPVGIPSVANAGWAQPKPPEPVKLPDLDKVLAKVPSTPGKVTSRVVYGTVERYNGRDAAKSETFTFTDADGKLSYDTKLSHPTEATRALRPFVLKPPDVRSTRVTAVDKIRGRDVYVVEVKPETGRRERWYYDQKTGELLRIARELETPIGILPEQVDFENFKRAGGTHLPFTTTWSRADYRVTFKVKDVK